MPNWSGRSRNGSTSEGPGRAVAEARKLARWSTRWFSSREPSRFRIYPPGTDHLGEKRERDLFSQQQFAQLGRRIGAGKQNPIRHDDSSASAGRQVIDEPFEEQEFCRSRIELVVEVGEKAFLLCGVRPVMETRTTPSKGFRALRGWRLAPVTMAWESAPGVPLSTHDLCARLKDTTRNGNRDSTPQVCFKCCD
jgi:hypothetical protein